MSGTRKGRKWLLWGNKERIRQFYFIDSAGKQYKCRQTLLGRFIKLFRRD